MGAIHWDRGEWTALYVAIATPFGLLMRLVPGSLKLKEEPRCPGE